MPFHLGGQELLIILVVVLLLFGGRKLPELAKGLGEGLREFKKATHEAPPSADLGACPVETKPGLQVTRYNAPRAVVDQARALARGASIDVGGIEYLVGRDDARVYFYDVNATSNFVANAPEVLGFDPFPEFADYIVRVATSVGNRPIAD